MSIQDLNAIKANTNYVIENIDNETKAAAKKIENLFAGQKFYNGGEESAEEINKEIQTLKNYLKQKEEEAQQNYTLLKYTNTELNKLNMQLEKEIFDVTQQANKDERLQKMFIERAIDEVNEQYMNGEIEKSEMSNVLAQKVSRYNKIDASILSASSRLSNTKSKIEMMTNKIASIIDRANGLERESKIAQGSLIMMQNLMEKMSINFSNSATAEGERPVYTPTKAALVDSLAIGIKGLTNDGNYDKNSIGNPQLQKMKEFLGMNSEAGIDDKTGILQNSMLLEMKNAGFSEKEALYAINWIFDKCNLSYQPGQKWSVPYGHGDEAKSVYNELINQTQKLWGTDVEQVSDAVTADSSSTVPKVETGDISEPQEENTASVNNPKRTDPIGYAIGDVTYEFIMDRNSDGKFNNKSEFLGAQNGIEELKSLDLDGDGNISSKELSSNENLFVLMTNHKTGKHSFMSASSGNIDSIDLSTLTSQNWTNINDNKLKNIFAVNTVSGGTVTGYQTEDNDFYVEKSYNGALNSNMAITIDDAALQKAQNIFNSIVEMGTSEYEKISADASKSVKAGQNHVENVADSMEENAQTAESGLRKADRPETAEEKEQREAEEAKKREEEEEIAKKEKAEKEEKEKKEKAEEK